jgi:hypothetical protein
MSSGSDANCFAGGVPPGYTLPLTSLRMERSLPG